MEHLAQVCSSWCGASTHVLRLVPSAETALLNFLCPLSDWKPSCFPAPGRGMRCGKSWGLFQDGPPNTFSATFSRLARLPLFLWVRLRNYSTNKKVLCLQQEVSTEHWWVQVTSCILMFFSSEFGSTQLPKAFQTLPISPSLLSHGVSLQLMFSLSSTFCLLYLSQRVCWKKKQIHSHVGASRTFNLKISRVLILAWEVISWYKERD